MNSSVPGMGTSTESISLPPARIFISMISLRSRRVSGGRLVPHGQRLRFGHAVALRQHMRKHALAVRVAELQVHVIGIHGGHRCFRRVHQVRIRLARYPLHHALFGEVHPKLVGRVFELAVRITVGAVALAGVHRADGAVLQRDHGGFGFHHGVVARETGPRRQPDLARTLLVIQFARLPPSWGGRAGPEPSSSPPPGWKGAAVWLPDRTTAPTAFPVPFSNSNSASRSVDALLLSTFVIESGSADGDRLCAWVGLPREYSG